MTAEPAAEADLDMEIAALAPGVGAPRTVPGAAVLVIGPWLGGVSSLVSALRRLMPDRQFVESDELAPGSAPAAIVFAVSAVAPVAESDCALLDTATRHTDLVIGALTKIDLHHDWRAVLSADVDAVTARAPRLRDMPWVGVAAAPGTGAPQLDDLIALLRERLADDTLPRRNRLRAWETHLEEQLRAASDRDDEAAALHRQRDDIVRAARLSRTERTIALRSRVQQARVQLGYFARNRCASVRTELSEDAACWGGVLRGRRSGDFQAYVRGRAAETIAEVDRGIDEQFRDIAAELDLTAPPASPATVVDIGAPGLASRGLETQLMLLLGAGFGLGVALATGRLFTGLAPGLAVAGAVAGGLLGLLLTLWVVGIRGLLNDRAVLDRWVGRVTTTLREATDALVATRVLVAEVAFTGQLTEDGERSAAETARQVAVIDARLRDRAVAAARAANAVEARKCGLRTALDAVRDGLIIR